MPDGLKDFFGTPERTAAWIFRLLITLLGAAGTTIVWLAWGILTDVRADVKGTQTFYSKVIQDIREEQGKHDTSIQLLTQITNDQSKILQDHEVRIRQLEHK